MNKKLLALYGLKWNPLLIPKISGDLLLPECRPRRSTSRQE